MKITVMIVVALILGLGSLYLMQGQTRTEHEQWKYSFVEPETMQRPAHFDDMKFKPEAELRSPASKEK